MTLPNLDELEQLGADWGPLSCCREHQPGDHITYRLLGMEHTGMILWLQPPHTLRGKRAPVRYILRRGCIPLVSVVERLPNFRECQGIGEDEVSALPGRLELLFEVKERAILVLTANGLLLFACMVLSLVGIQHTGGTVYRVGPAGGAGSRTKSTTASNTSTKLIISHRCARCK